MQLAYGLFVARKFETCSTLRRVEPHATALVALWHPKGAPLQYPQTGRTSCNLLAGTLSRLVTVLAVPSDGSNLMQQSWPSSRQSNQNRRAVPSDGSNLMQQAGHARGKAIRTACSTLRRV